MSVPRTWNIREDMLGYSGDPTLPFLRFVRNPHSWRWAAMKQQSNCSSVGEFGQIVGCRVD
jgi:hypothetical protein